MRDMSAKPQNLRTDVTQNWLTTNVRSIEVDRWMGQSATTNLRKYHPLPPDGGECSFNPEPAARATVPTRRLGMD